MYEHPLYHWPPKSLWLEKSGKPRTWDKYDIYVHYPFCRNICDYCGYETRIINRASSQKLITSLVQEIEQHRATEDFSNSKIQSVFFGGGTASLMRENDIDRLLDSIYSYGNRIGEITLECEPGTLSRQKLRALKDFGVNRFSICAQSFDGSMLKKISRRHTSSDVFRLIDDCLAVGVNNLHLDLMYGLPDQTLGHWEATLKQALDLPFVHISTYKFYIFKHGALHRSGAHRPFEEIIFRTSELEEMHRSSQVMCAEAGLYQYTLTEFCKKNNRCTHLYNSLNDGDLLAIGPSAFGRNKLELWKNSPFVTSYGNSDARKAEERAYYLSPTEAFKRRVILGLWLLEVNVFSAAKTYGLVPNATLIHLLKNLRDKHKVLYSDDGTVSLSEQIRFWAGEPMAQLASLPIECWTDEDPLPSMEAKSERVIDTDEYEVASILRMVRRDPHLYKLFKTYPHAALGIINHGLSSETSKLLGDEITMVNKNGKPTGSNYQKAWIKVINEYESF